MKTLPGIVLLVAILTLVVAPATCSGGLLAHCCDPGDSDHETDHHDHACPVDPCNWESMLAPAKSVDDDDAPDRAPACAVLPVDTAHAHDGGAFAGRNTVPLLAPATRTARSLPLLC